MKTKILLLLLLNTAGVMFGQEEFKKHYLIPNSLVNGHTLKKEIQRKYEDLDENDKKELTKGYNIGDKIKLVQKVNVSGKELEVIKEIIVDEAFFKTFTKSETVDANLNYRVKAMVAVSKDKLIVNPYLSENKNVDNNTVYFYKLKNRENISLWTKSWTVNAITIPVKYRFKGKNGLKEDFSTGINGNFFVGYSFGRTNYLYQEEVGTKENTWKITGGILLGASSVKLNKSNTNLSKTPILDDSEFTKGLGSFAFGFTYSYNSINFGAFLGFDYAIGEDAEIWNHNKKPWLGIGVGYKIF
ncbi:hypothetical protein [Chryseobacterium daeguense]|uniref:hypothetical protein n=1 Tax=Chryseobacterium daeguense TaxID=412438 RepID=UPI0003FBDD09|nr:hypothetical protein [Chryseobacterium daeguense]